MQTVFVPPIDDGADFDSIMRGQVLRGERGEYYKIDRFPHEFDPAFDSIETALQEKLSFLEDQLRRSLRLEELLFVDIETMGLSPRYPLFLIGALSFADVPRLQLFLARSREEEPAVLQAFAELAQGKVLVTFNGRFFDWPYIAKRSTHHQISVGTPRAHFDVLPYARKHWRKHLPNCRLQTLEHYYCQRQRQDDIPSAHIPARYRKFCTLHRKTGNAANLLLPIIHHNYWDVLTMADLLIKAG